MSFVAWFEILVGVVIAGLWLTLLATGRVPEVAAGHRDIWFHIAAELLTAILLVGAGVALLRSDGDAARLAAAVAAGALLYTTVDSPGYYAERGQWPVVGMFAVLAGVTVIVVVIVVLGATTS